MKHHRGMTLIELIVVLTILAVMAAIALPMIHAGFNSYITQRNLVDANWQGRLALARMTRDIRNIPSANATTLVTTTSTDFKFTDNTNTSVEYTLSGTNLQRNAITLANGIGSVTFGYYDKTGAVTATPANMRYVSIALNITENNVNITVWTVVNLRVVVL